MTDAPEAAISLRPADAEDVQFVARVYGLAMGDVLRGAGLDLAQQGALLLAQWNPAEIRIIRAAERDVGWLQVGAAPDAVVLRNICVAPGWQRLGIGSAVLRLVLAEAACAGLPVELGVARGNPAHRLYRRFGFRITHEDGHHHYMRLDS